MKEQDIFTAPMEEGTGGTFDPFGAEVDLCSDETGTNPFGGEFAEDEPAGTSGSDGLPQTKLEKPADAPEGEPDAEDIGEEESPLNAALQAQEKKTITSIFSQPPVFSYNGATEDIEDAEQTFDCLREAKAVDFPELDDAKSVSWTVTYGKIVKAVTNPDKAKVGEFKREIEKSKEFLDAIKKSKDKAPRCMAKPQIHMQKKGIAAYKGVFPDLESARASGKAICYIPGNDGSIYEMRKNDMGEFVTQAGKIAGFDTVRAGFKPALPPIPYPLVSQVISLFRHLTSQQGGVRPVEALAQIYWDKANQSFFANIPKQTVTKHSVSAVLENGELLDADRYVHYADMHSHNDMEARFSSIDDADERANRIYIVVGRLDRYYPDISARISNGGTFLAIPAESVIEPMRGGFRQCWLENIKIAENCDRKGLMAS